MVTLSAAMPGNCDENHDENPDVNHDENHDGHLVSYNAGYIVVMRTMQMMMMMTMLGCKLFLIFHNQLSRELFKCHVAGQKSFLEAVSVLFWPFCL